MTFTFSTSLPLFAMEAARHAANTSDRNILFVASIQKFPCLYNYNTQEYLKKDITDKAWNEVAQQVKLSVPECKEKWRNLRYSLLRSLKPNSDGTLKKKYYLHKSMEFIIPFMKSSKSLTTKFEDETDDDMSSHDLSRDVTSPQQQLFEYEFHRECNTSVNNEFDNSEPVTKRKRSLEHFQSVQNVSDSLEARRWFMLGLMPEVNALSEEQMKHFRRKVLTLLDEISQEGSIVFEDENATEFNTTQVKVESTDRRDSNDSI